MAEVVRLSLRCGSAPLGPLGAAFGVALPSRPLTAATRGARAALWLGPDEWLLLAEDAAAASLIPALEAARGAAAASITDISDRQVGLELTGPSVPELLAEGCPLDLGTFAIDGCTRTLFGKVEIVLWRRSLARWRVEVARSFAAHLRAHLAEAAADAA
jgi:sarcosine oxidase subunit gamma